MNSLIDNTGLHSTYRTLTSNSKGTEDIENLFQFGMNIMFCEELNLGGFEHSQVYNKTNEILDFLSGLGITNELIKVGSYDSDLFTNLCQTTATNSINDVLDYTPKSVLGNIGLLPSNINWDEPSGSITFDEIISEKYNLNDSQGIQKEFLNSKMLRAVHYMFSLNKELRNAIKKNRNLDLRNKDDIYGLHIILRYRLNEQIAKSKGLKYVPSVARSKLVTYSHMNFLQQLTEGIDKTVETKLATKLKTPSVINYLHNNAKGNPLKLIDFSLKAREKTTEIRKWLNKIGQEKDDLSINDNLLVSKEIEHLINLLKSELGIRSNDTKDSIRLTLGILSITLDRKGMQTKLKRMLNRGKLSVLTEIANTGIFKDRDINLENYM